MNITIRKLDSTTDGFKQQLSKLLAFEAETDDAIESAVTKILADVKARGDAAVLEYTVKFDRIPGGAASMAAFDLTQDELQAALKLKRERLQPIIEAFECASQLQR